MALKGVFLDFDGVVLESVDIKTDAFRQLFKDYHEHVDNIVKFHVDNAGMSRYEKFEIIYRDYLQRPLRESQKVRLGESFSQLVFEELLRCPFVHGALEFLETYSGRYDLFVASATPEDELKQIVVKRGLTSFFQGIHGSPRQKASILDETLREYGWRPSEAIFVGDAKNDYLAAQTAGVPFVGRVPRGSSSPFAEGVSMVVEDLVELNREWTVLLQRLLV